MARLADRPLGRIYLALIAAGAVVGALSAAVTVVVEQLAGRRT
jgi:energy-converting hydrogenase Eha subunit A